MRFVVREPSSDENVNVTPVHPLREFLTLSLGVVLVGTLIFFALGWLSEQIAIRLPVSAEASSLEMLWGGMEAQDPQAHPRLAQSQELLDRLLVHLRDEGQPYSSRASLSLNIRLFLHESPDPNAFALPGGVVMLSRGLLDSVESENELAFVLGHELGHVKNRDHLRRLGRSILLQIGLSLIVGKTAAVGSQGISQLIEGLSGRSLDRSHEYNADEMGLELLFWEYGHVNGASHFFERMEQSPLVAASSWLSTHPAGKDRIARLRAIAKERRWPREGELRRMER